MPSKSPAQAKLMRAVAHGWKPDRMEGPSVGVAKDFMEADMRKKRRRYQQGGFGRPMSGLPPQQDPRMMQAMMAAAQGAPPTLPTPGIPPSQRGVMQQMMANRRRNSSGNRVGIGDQQGGLARAMQTQTGRPPISRRAAFPGSRQNQF